MQGTMVSAMVPFFISDPITRPGPPEAAPV